MEQTTAQNHLVYIAFGGSDFRNEVKSSILSLFLIPSAAQSTDIIVYTDYPNDFKEVFDPGFKLIYEEVNKEQFQQWRGEIDFIHRIKIEVIYHALSKYDGNILYLDSDTYFLKDPSPIFESLAGGTRFMHLYESTLRHTTGFHRRIYQKILEKTSPALAAALHKTKMYNAGVIGVKSGDDALLREVISRTEVFYRIYPAHVMEQLSFSMCLGEAGELKEAAPYILHYWHMKEARTALAEFFRHHSNQPADQILKSYAEFPLLRASDKKYAWERKPRWLRAILRLLGIGWRWPA